MTLAQLAKPETATARPSSVARNERLASLEMEESSTTELMVKLRIENKEQAEALIAMDNEELRSTAGLDRLGQARTFRSILRAALQEVD